MDNVISLVDLFHQRLFQVPDYQRGYSWENRQVQEFLEDLELLTPGTGRYHYTGTVVLHEVSSADQRMDTEGNLYAPVDIVDGQQRLTTIVLLLDGIRRQLAGSSESGQELAMGIKKNFVSVDESSSGLNLFRLSLNADTDHFFKASVLAELPTVEGPQITSERRLESAKQQIADYLSDNSGGSENTGEKWLRDLYLKVVNQLRFTLYQVGNEAEVGVIFEVMNDRGKPLTDLEKVKNYLLYTSASINAHDELSKSVNGAWTEILRQLMAAGLVSPQDEDRLLRAHWLTHYDSQSRQWHGSRSVKTRFDMRKYGERYPELLKDLIDYTEGLRASCITFCDAYRPNRSNAFELFKTKPGLRTQVIEWSEKLVRVGVVATFLPLLMAIRERWPQDPDKYLEILKLCEPFAFRLYRWQGARADAGQAALFRLGYDLATNEKRTYEDTVKAILVQFAYWCKDDDFEFKTSVENPYNWYAWGGLRYFLYEREIFLAAKQGASPNIEWDQLPRDLQDTIEHSLPQSINERPYWEERFSTQDHQRYLHDLGNLTLTKGNSALGNKPFPDKKGDASSKGYCYTKSPLYVERELTEWQNWDASAIQNRQSRLLEWAKERWTVDLSGMEGEDHEPELEEPELDEDAIIFADDGYDES